MLVDCRQQLILLSLVPVALATTETQVFSLHVIVVAGIYTYWLCSPLPQISGVVILLQDLVILCVNKVAHL